MTGRIFAGVPKAVLSKRLFTKSARATRAARNKPWIDPSKLELLTLARKKFGPNASKRKIELWVKSMLE
ncbi:MAG: hypothetical protein WCW44_05170 [archaeon]|jgi:hypothetical protein